MDSGHDIACVYCQPPRAAGRGQKVRLSPVHKFAEQAGLAIRTPVNFKDAEDIQDFAALDLDIAVVAAYGLILPQPILDAPRLGCVNVHASLLPRWRGAAPIQRAILAGDAETGVTIMQMDEGLDTGPMLMAEKISITSETTGGSLHDNLSELGARLIVEAVASLAAGTLPATPQPSEGVTYAAKIEKSEARIDWGQPALGIDRLIRAFSPWPGAWFAFSGERFKVISATLADGSGGAGEILDDQLLIACGDGALRIERLQRAGKAPMDREELLRGFSLPQGECLDS